MTIALILLFSLTRRGEATCAGDCLAEFRNAQNNGNIQPFCKRCRVETGAQAFGDRCSACCANKCELNEACFDNEAPMRDWAKPTCLEQKNHGKCEKKRIREVLCKKTCGYCGETPSTPAPTPIEALIVTGTVGPSLYMLFTFPDEIAIQHSVDESLWIFAVCDSSYTKMIGVTIDNATEKEKEPILRVAKYSRGCSEDPLSEAWDSALEGYYVESSAGRGYHLADITIASSGGPPNRRLSILRPSIVV